MKQTNKKKQDDPEGKSEDQDVIQVDADCEPDQVFDIKIS